MARPLRIEYPNAVYHVTSRGNARNRIFLGDLDREIFLSVLEAVVRRSNWLCHAYCLMDNHYHLILETPDANLSRGMGRLNGMYTQKYNQRHGKTGHIFQGRYSAVLVDKENYLMELCRYVVLNPLRLNMADNPAAWKWSSYRATAGLIEAPGYLFVDRLLGCFSRNNTEARTRYRRFVKQGLRAGSPWDKLQGQVLLGGKRFIEKHKALLSGKEQVAEIPRSQRYVSRPRLAELFVDTGDRRARNRRMHAASVKYGYTLKEIGDHLGLHYTTVSKAIQGVEQKQQTGI